MKDPIHKGETVIRPQNFDSDLNLPVSKHIRAAATTVSPLSIVNYEGTNINMTQFNYKTTKA